MSVDPSSRAGVVTRLRTGQAVTVAVVVVLVVVLGVGSWASQQGYISLGRADCTDEGYEPMPTYDVLVSEHGKSPYCARLTRGETWF